MAQAKTLYTVNLSNTRNTARHNRAAKAMRILRDFVAQHHNTEDVRISATVNNYVWRRGAENPPSSIDIQVVDRDDHVVVEHATTESEPSAETEESVEEETTDAAEEPGADAPADLPQEVVDTLSDGTVSDAKDALQGEDAAVLEAALTFEEAHKDRKTLRRFIESQLQSDE